MVDDLANVVARLRRVAEDRYGLEEVGSYPFLAVVPHQWRPDQSDLDHIEQQHIAPGTDRGSSRVNNLPAFRTWWVSKMVEKHGRQGSKLPAVEEIC